MPEFKATHNLKTWSMTFQAVWDDRKTFEWRFNDRDYRTGDTLKLLEYDPKLEKYTGREIEAKITYCLYGKENSPFGVPKGYVIMSIEVSKKIDADGQSTA